MSWARPRSSTYLIQSATKLTENEIPLITQTHNRKSADQIDYVVEIIIKRKISKHKKLINVFFRFSILFLAI